MANSTKVDAYRFLSDFESELRSLPNPEFMAAWVRSTVAAAKGNRATRHLSQPERAFLNGHVIPALFRAISNTPEMTADGSRHALLNEYWETMPEYSVKSPARTIYHPFNKVLGANAETIYRGWTLMARKVLYQPCPDFALRSPFPHKIVFEGKYFENGSLTFARQQLAINIFQAFFYRGLPPVPANKRGRAEWDYDYACLLAYDASPGGTLRKAWEELPANVKKGFWDGANLYVMIVGGQGRPRKVANR